MPAGAGEATAARTQAHAVWHRSIAERVAAGQAINNIQIVSVGFDGMITLSCRVNESRFREGDMLILSHDSSLGAPYLRDTTHCVALAAETGCDGMEVLCDDRLATRDPHQLRILSGQYEMMILVVHTPFRERVPD